jgi:hypothetical protein
MSGKQGDKLALRLLSPQKGWWPTIKACGFHNYVLCEVQPVLTAVCRAK